jgi:hypothetical protein
MIFKNKPFNQNLAIGIFVVAVIAWVIGVGINRFTYDKEVSFLGTVVYFDMALFASIISGLISGNKGVMTERRKKE